MARLLHKKNAGVSMIEVLLASSILLIFIGAVVLANTVYLRSLAAGLYKVRATYLAEEGIEAVKLLRDQSWDNRIVPLTVGSENYLTYNSTLMYWATTTDNTYVDGIFERHFVLENVYRDSNDDIASSGSVDDGSRKLTVSVSWFFRGATSTKSVSTYLFNVWEN